MVNSEESESHIVVRRIGVIDDHDSVIEGLRGFFADTDDLHLVVGAHTVGDLLAQLTSDSPDMGLPLDLVVLDLRLGDGSTPAGNIAELSEAGVSTLVYTSGDEPYLVRDAAGAGTLGVVRKNATKTEVCAAVRTAASGSTVVSMDWAAALDSDPQFVDLPTRLREVLELYAAGGSGLTSLVSWGSLRTLSTNTSSAFVVNTARCIATLRRRRTSTKELSRTAGFPCRVGIRRNSRLRYGKLCPQMMGLSSDRSSWNRLGCGRAPPARRLRATRREASPSLRSGNDRGNTMTEATR